MISRARGKDRPGLGRGVGSPNIPESRRGEFQATSVLRERERGTVADIHMKIMFCVSLSMYFIIT